MNIVLLQNNNRHVSATHVAVFRVMTTRIKNKYNVRDDIGKVSAVHTASSLASLDHNSPTASSTYIIPLNYYFYLARQPPVGHGLLLYEVSRSHTTTHHSR